jgi:hypothetical protein
MTRATTEPERELVRRAAPFGLPASALALAVGWAVGGGDIGWSAALGIVVVTLNFVANGLSLARAARVSLALLQAVALGGFLIRLIVIFAIMAGLNHLAFFSPLAFGLAAMPATVLLLVFEMRLLAGGLGQELQIPAPASAVSGRRVE